SRVLIDLGGELPGRGQHERACRATTLREQPLNDGKHERRRPPAARHRAREHVTTRHRERNGFLLNGRGTREPELACGTDDQGVEAEAGEGHAGGGGYHAGCDLGKALPAARRACSAADPVPTLASRLRIGGAAKCAAAPRACGGQSPDIAGPEAPRASARARRAKPASCSPLVEQLAHEPTTPRRQRRPRAIVLSRPMKTIVHAVSASQMKTRGTTRRKGASIADASLKVATVYMPSGNTRPQNPGS